jgi:bis(5'-nucleosyl)-tetraphosphatase (symmetrical)
VTRYAIGDIQGCYEELRSLLAQLRFSAERDRLWLVGDLVNRGPASLQVLRYVRAMGDNAVVVLGNHDLHLLAVALGSRRPRRSDTLQDILAAPDRDALLEWLLTRPLAYLEPGRNGRAPDLLVHAGLPPQWTVELALALAREVQDALQTAPAAVFENMYGDEPDRWSSELAGPERIRFTINVLTRLRVCTDEGQVDLKSKGKPPPPGAVFKPWFDVPTRRSRLARIIFGHWSALGLVHRNDVVGLDTGCVWGGSLTALDLDHDSDPVAVGCAGHQTPDE